MLFIKKYRTYIVFVGITLLLGALSALVSGNFGAYAEMVKPPFAPPPFVFPIVWTILYTLMGIAAAIVYESRDLDKFTAIKLYALQLFINIVWPVIFFRFRAAKFALFWLLLLIITVLATYKSFRSVSKTSANLLIPYIIWLLIAFYLNFGIIILNS